MANKAEIKKFLKDKKEKKYSFLLMILALPTFLGWIFPLIMCVIRLASWKTLGISNGILFANWRKDFNYSTALGRGIVFSKELRNPSRSCAHERVHVRQFEDACLHGLMSSVLAAILGCGWLSLLFWPIGMFFLSTNFISAGLRFGKYGVYRDSEHERSAYAQTDLGEFGTSWSMNRDAAREEQKGFLS